MIQSLDCLEVLKNCLFMMLLINILDDVDFEMRSRRVIQALPQSSKSYYGMANGCHIVALLQNELGPEVAADRPLKEAGEFMRHVFSKDLEVSAFLFCLVDRHAGSVLAHGWNSGSELK